MLELLFGQETGEEATLELLLVLSFLPANLSSLHGPFFPGDGTSMNISIFSAPVGGGPDADRIEIFPNREVAGKIDGDLPV